MKKRIQTSLHVLLWLGLTAFHLYFSRAWERPIPWYWMGLEFLQTLTFHIALFYFNWFVLVPQILARNKVLLYASSVLLTLTVFSAVRAPLEIYAEKFLATFDPALARQQAKWPEHLTFGPMMLQLAIMGVLNIFLSSSLKVTGDYLRNEQRRKELEHQQVTTELALLKSQVNPHFLFNTLNNLYSLAYQNSPQTPDAILKLSLLLRYQLYETNTPLVPLAREVEHLQHLLDLHRLRLPNPALLSLQITGPVDLVQVPPMLMMPLVENLFKHSLTSAAMSLHLSISPYTLTFTTYNQAKNSTSPMNYGGLGLQNLKRRLELLYPQRHTLVTRQEDQTFTATLTLSGITT